MREEGIYKNIDIDTYHSEEGISSSGINLILDCPKRYWYEYHGKPKLDGKELKKERDKFKVGTALHMLILEPTKFEQTFYVMTEEVNLSTNIGKEKYAEAERLANGREIIRAGDWTDIEEMAKSARSHSVWESLKDGKAEHSLYWNSGALKTRLRARPDIYNNFMIMDVKTTDSIRNFQRSIYQFGYHRQAAMQIDGLKHLDPVGDTGERLFAFFVIEKKAPYLTACFTLDKESLNQGRIEYKDGANKYSTCLKDNNWEGYNPKFEVTSLPQWAINKEEI